MTHDAAKLDVFVSHRSALIEYAASILGCRARAEDVVQEAYLRFAAHSPPDRRVEQPANYLYRIVRNLALDWARRLSAEGRRDEAHFRLHEDHLVSSPEHAAILQEELVRVQRALEELPDRARLAFEMQRFGGYTFHQIAAQLGVSVATAHRLSRDALSHIMRALNDADG